MPTRPNRQRPRGRGITQSGSRNPVFIEAAEPGGRERASTGEPVSSNALPLVRSSFGGADYRAAPLRRPGAVPPRHGTASPQERQGPLTVHHTPREWQSQHRSRRAVPACPAEVIAALRNTSLRPSLGLSAELSLRVVCCVFDSLPEPLYGKLIILVPIPLTSCCLQV